MSDISHARGRVSFFSLMLCGLLACAMLLPAPMAYAAAGALEAQLEMYIMRDPAHFNEHMWALIHANPQAKQQIFSSAVRLSLKREIALAPQRRTEILEKFKQLYPDMASELETVAAVDAQAQPTDTPPNTVALESVESYNKPLRKIKLAEDRTIPRTWWGRNWGWVALGAAAAGGGVVAAVALSSSSSDSDSAAEPLPDPPTVGETQELNNQSGVAQIGADVANTRGFTGTGIKVAVLDSGVNTLHPDLNDNIAAGGYDFINGTSNVTDTDTDFYHGTHVAGVIAAEKNSFGMRGVAYTAKILPYAVIGSGAPLNAIVDAVAVARNQGADVMNASYGPSFATTQVFSSVGAQLFWDQALAEADAYQAAANNGMILVFAAGNEFNAGVDDIAQNPTGGGFLPFIKPANANITLGTSGAYRKLNSDNSITILNADYSSLESMLLAVVAVDSSNVIASYSNRCGVTADWCVAAPGNSITSTSSSNTYDALSGTSFAAPHVAGAIAVLLSQHPELTPAQVVNLLKNTAVDLGAAGVDAVYGHGLIDLDAATASTGPFMVTLGTNMVGPVSPLTNSTMLFSPVFGGSVARTLAAAQIGVLDAYTRNFTVTLNRQVNAPVSAYDNMTALRRFGQKEFRPEIALDDTNTVSFTMRTKGSTKREADNNRESSLASYSLTHTDEDMSINVSHGEPRTASLYYQQDDRQLLSADVVASGIGNPYLDFVSEGYAEHVTLDAPWNGKFRAMTAMGGPAGDGDQRNMLAMGEVGFGDEESGISLVGGALIEQDRVLGIHGDGAFALGQGTTTMFSGVNALLKLADDTQLQMSWYSGLTRASGDDNSLIQGIDNIRTSSWRAGLTQSNIAQDDDRLRLNVSQPLRAESGALLVNLPQYRLRDGTIISRTEGFNLAPSGRELDFEVGYQMPLGDATKADFAAMYRRDAGHVANSNEALGVARLNHSF